MFDVEFAAEDWVIEVNPLTSVVEVSSSPIEVVEMGGVQGLSGAIALAEHIAATNPHPQYMTYGELAAHGWVTRRLEVVQSEPILSREIIHNWTVDPTSIVVTLLDGEVITDRILIKISNPGVAISISTEIAIAYRVLLGG